MILMLRRNIEVKEMYVYGLFAVRAIPNSTSQHLPLKTVTNRLSI